MSRPAGLVGGDRDLNPGMSGFEQGFQPGPLSFCSLLCVACESQEVSVSSWGLRLAPWVRSSQPGVSLPAVLICP